MPDKSYTVVAGGAGFLGSHLCRNLVQRGERVLCIDNFYTGKKNIVSELESFTNFEFLEKDIIELIKLDLPIKKIVNFACPASPFYYQKDPIYTLRVCFEGTLNLLNLAEKKHAPIFHASTSEIYGDPLVHPQTTSYWGNVNPIGVRSCYDEGKRISETLFFDFHRTLNIDIKVARIFNTYGPNMDINDGRVVSNFIVQALKESPITVYGDGTQTRSFCYVDDLINGFVSLMDSKPELTGPYNLGNPTEYTIKELAEKIIKLTNSRSKIIYSPLPSDDPIRRKPDISSTVVDLRWKPKIELEEGLQKSIEYFKQII